MSALRGYIHLWTVKNSIFFVLYRIFIYLKTFSEILTDVSIITYSYIVILNVFGFWIWIILWQKIFSHCQITFAKAFLEIGCNNMKIQIFKKCDFDCLSVNEHYFIDLLNEAPLQGRITKNGLFLTCKCI